MMMYPYEKRIVYLRSFSLSLSNEKREKKLRDQPFDYRGILDPEPCGQHATVRATESDHRVRNWIRGVNVSGAVHHCASIVVNAGGLVQLPVLFRGVRPVVPQERDQVHVVGECLLRSQIPQSGTIFVRLGPVRHRYAVVTVFRKHEQGAELFGYLPHESLYTVTQITRTLLPRLISSFMQSVWHKIFLVIFGE